MNKIDFFEIVSGILAVPANSLSMESTPDQIPSWDSLAQVTICAALEQTLNIEFSIAEMLSMKSISDFVEALRKHGVTFD